MHKPIRMGVLCPSNIAKTRFMPALAKSEDFEYVGIAHANAEERFNKGNPIRPDILAKGREKAEEFQALYGGKIFDSYAALVESDAVDAIYLPLPPALHHIWGLRAMEHGKHILLEKPSSTCVNETRELLTFAEKKNLAIHENYMFVFHGQLKVIEEQLREGTIGDLRLIRTAFGFPSRGSEDFRYHKDSGGGALLDCGGYPLKLATLFLGESTRVVQAKLHTKADFDVDLYGDAVLCNAQGMTAQLAFGMDNQYVCELELWGSKGRLIADRVFTAPANLPLQLQLKQGNEKRTLSVEADDQFLGSIQSFYQCIVDSKMRERRRQEILLQSQLLEDIKNFM